MILLDVKNYLADKIVCNLQMLSLHFQCDADVMRDLLAHWIRKGKIIQENKPTVCSSCCVQCRTCDVEVYRYVM